MKVILNFLHYDITSATNFKYNDVLKNNHNISNLFNISILAHRDCELEEFTAPGSNELERPTLVLVIVPHYGSCLESTVMKNYIA